MKKVIKLTESDLARIVKRVISEQPTTGQAQGGGRPTTGQAQGSSVPNTPITGSKIPTGGKPGADVVISPQIKIDCKRRVIVSSQLPKLDNNANFTIINHYCNK